jgi:hypothetical protein
MLFITTEAVICMKTNKTGIICHGNQWTFSAKPSAVGPGFSPEFSALKGGPTSSVIYDATPSKGRKDER